MRRLLEMVTGVYTGSDMNLNLTSFGHGLGMAGEETVAEDNLCWITKTHWPLPGPIGDKAFSAQKCISIVRSPVDILPSMCYLMNLMSHSLSPQERINEQFPEYWDAFVSGLSGIFNQ